MRLTAQEGGRNKIRKKRKRMCVTDRQTRKGEVIWEWPRPLPKKDLQYARL